MREMPDVYWALSDTKFVEWVVGGYPVMVPHFLVERHGNRLEWEKPRFQSMEKHLYPGWTLFDVGSEQGYMSAIYARFVGGGDNMVLMEPVPQVWPNTLATWRANNLLTPRGVWCGFVNDYGWTSDYHDFKIGYRDGWPECAYDTNLLDATKFRYTGEHAHSTDAITIDKYVADTGIEPDAITIDVEGYEPCVLRGAVETIRNIRPLIWASIHPVNNIYEKFRGGNSAREVHDIMDEHGYRGELLSEDHEAHWLFLPD